MEGQFHSLIKTSFSGVPPPKVTWWKAGVLFDSSDEVARPGLIVNRLRVRGLQRQDLGTRFACRAENTNRTAPVAREVKIMLNRELEI